MAQLHTSPKGTVSCLDMGRIVKHCTKKPSTAGRKHHSVFLNYLKLQPTIAFLNLLSGFSARFLYLVLHQAICREQWIWVENKLQSLRQKGFHSIWGNNKHICWSFGSVSMTNCSCFQSDLALTVTICGTTCECFSPLECVSGAPFQKYTLLAGMSAGPASL